MSDVTQILRQIDAGDPSAADQLLPLVYDELRKLAAARMARESPDHTLQPTALVHEAYVRLVKDCDQQWDDRGHFFAAAAEAMRRILVEGPGEKARPSVVPNSHVLKSMTSPIRTVLDSSTCCRWTTRCERLSNTIPSQPNWSN